MKNNKVSIVTDTASSISQVMAKEYDIALVPHHIIMNGKDYLGTEINKDLFYSWFEEDKDKTNHPKTAAPSVGEFLALFKNLSRKSPNILFISVSSGNTGTYNIALQARDLLREEMPSINIQVVDSFNEHGGQFLIVREAARAAASDKNMTEVLEIVDRMVQRVTLFYLLNTLYHLALGGRTGKANSWAGSMVNFKPLLELSVHTKGIVTPVARFRTKSQGIEKMLQLLEERVGKSPLHAVITQGNVPQEAEDLKRRLLSGFTCAEICLTETCLAPEVHQGPGAIRLGFYCDK